MTNSILAIKGNMESRFNQNGQRIPVTVLLAEPNVAAAVKEDKILLGLGKKKKIKKPENNFVEKVGFAPKFKKEVKKTAEVKIGDKISVSVFSPGDVVKITGITKGKGFAGVVKRWGFHGGPKTHGQSDRHRAPGSIGQGTTPGRVFKGKKMAGHYGNVKKTIINLQVVDVDTQNNQILVKGAVPGATNGYLIIEKTGKVKNYVPLIGKDQEKISDKEEKKTVEEKEAESQTVKSEEKQEVKEKQNQKEESDKKGG